MPQIVYSVNALSNLERAFNYLAESADADAAIGAATAIREAVALLKHHPLLGRMQENHLRELVISYGKTGYVALYRHYPAKGEIRILAIRHQRELDYPV